MKFGQWLGLIALILSLYILWQIRQVVLLVFLAVIFSTALNRLVRRWRRSGVKRQWGAALAIACLLGAMAFMLYLIVPPFAQQFDQLAELVPAGLERLQVVLIAAQNRLSGSILDNLPRVDTLVQQVRPFATWAFNNFFALFNNVFTIVLSLFLVLVLTVMLLINPSPYRQGFLALFPAFYRPRMDEILTQCETFLVGWIRGTLINMVAIGLLSAIGLWLLGVPLVLANASLAGLLEAIPNVGPTLSVIPPTVVALLDAPWKAVAVIVFYIMLQQTEQYFLVPFVMSSQVNLLPAVTLLSQVIFAIFFGFLGLFLALPLVIVGQILIQEIIVNDVMNGWQMPSNQSVPSRHLH
ncbi:MAG: AI-2E family transporter [Oculatellaceae cyanobacterium Prado106]|nr:AI-2E family transporter [Oculatellaceae cyanobacterium Prado106]